MARIQDLTFTVSLLKMMFKATILATVLALAAGQQAVQQYSQNPYYNVPSSIVFPQQQYYNYFNSQNQVPFSFYGIKHFKNFPFISLVNNENQPIGYVYWADSDAVFQQQQNFIPIRDYSGNVFGYYALNQYKPGQQFQPQILNENIISQLGQFGFIYNQPNQEKFGFLVVKNPYFFNYHDNGVLRPNFIQYSRFQSRFPYNYFSPNYNGQYQYPQQYFYGKYQGQYVPRFQQYNQINQFPYNYQYIPIY